VILRTYAIGVLALAPILFVLLRGAPPIDLATGKAQLRGVWFALPAAWVAMLVLVGGVGPSGGLRGCARAIVPVAIAMIVVGIGGAALALPGLVLLVLLAPVAAFDGTAGERIAAALAARAGWRRLALVIGLVAIAFVALVLVTQRVVYPLPAKPTPAQLGAFVPFARIVALGLVVLVPAGAIAIYRVTQRSIADRH